MSVFTDAFASISAILGVSAEFRGSTIRALFKNGSVVINGVETRATIAECLDTDIPEIVHGDIITIADVEYTVIGIEPDAMAGYTTLILSRAS
jgi:ribosome-associated protein YbcJ (S4-like RNA binding protein)